MHLMQYSRLDVRDAQLKNVSKFVGLGAYRQSGCGLVKIGPQSWLALVYVVKINRRRQKQWIIKVWRETTLSPKNIAASEGICRRRII